MAEIQSLAAAQAVQEGGDVGPDAGVDLAVYQGEYRGILLGSGTPYHIESDMTGLVGTTMRIGDRPIPRGHGYIQGSDYAEERVVLLPMIVVETAHSQTLSEALGVLWNLLAPVEDEAWFRWNLFGATRRWRGRITRSAYNYGPANTRSGAFRVLAEFRAADPRIYSDELYTGFVTEAEVLDRGGFDLPSDLPFDMNPRIVSTQNIVQLGNTTSWPVIRFQVNGALTNWVQVENQTTGVTLRVDTPIPTNDTLVVNMDSYVRALPGPHIHIDNASRFGAWAQPREPFGLAPGDNVLVFTTDGDDVVCRFDWRYSWL